ncbi:MAG: phospho-sugar mutase [bacterium]|nr:phospho-sugar mutase [bacterium]
MDRARDNLSESAFNNLCIWLTKSRYEEYWPEIEAMITENEWGELEDSFFKILEFGTAGRRGKVGIGPNRINRITIGESAQALAEYLNSMKIINPSVAIGWDVRNSSKELAKLCAEVLVANGIKVYFFDEARSTPEISFAVRELEVDAGVVISASHNPPQDNGVKVYWRDGAQITSPYDKELMEIVKTINEIRTEDFSSALKEGKIELIGKAIDREYIRANVNLSLSDSRSTKIVFSPIHGTGWTNLLKTLLAAGFDQISVVKDQMIMDGNFSTLPDQKPNPENLSANLMAINQLKQERSDIGFTTDPDADRICVMSLEKNGEVRIFSGNEVAVLVADYLFSKFGNDQLKDGFICKSFVTTDALNALAQKYNVKIYDNLPVGFKFISKIIREKEIGGEKFLAGFEESLGGLIGSQTRDKDAATIGLMIAELVSELKGCGKTLGEKLNEIYNEVGFFAEKTDMIQLAGVSGFKRMNDLMASLRSWKIETSADFMNDYLVLERHNLKTGEKTKIDFSETSDALSFEFGDHEKRITIRPSGTEPKIKIYAQWRFSKAEERGNIERILNEFKEKIL